MQLDILLRWAAMSLNEYLSYLQHVPIQGRHDPDKKEAGEEKLHLLMVDDHIPAGAKLY